MRKTLGALVLAAAIGIAPAAANATSITDILNTLRNNLNVSTTNNIATAQNCQQITSGLPSATATALLQYLVLNNNGQSTSLLSQLLGSGLSWSTLSGLVQTYLAYNAYNNALGNSTVLGQIQTACNGSVPAGVGVNPPSAGQLPAPDRNSH